MSAYRAGQQRVHMVANNGHFIRQQPARIRQLTVVPGRKLSHLAPAILPSLGRRQAACRSPLWSINDRTHPLTDVLTHGFLTKCDIHRPWKRVQDGGTSLMTVASSRMLSGRLQTLVVPETLTDSATEVSDG